jgi:hypothetical protein
MPSAPGHSVVILQDPLASTASALKHKLAQKRGQKGSSPLQLAARQLPAAPEAAPEAAPSVVSVPPQQAAAPGSTPRRLKCSQQNFNAILNWEKRVEIRPDEGYQVGDVLTLCEWSPLASAGFTGREASVTVTHVLRAAGGIADGMCALSVAPGVGAIEMVLYCPACSFQHIDRPRPEEGWMNPPHKSHRCELCDYVWRPADVCTMGVQQTRSSGKHDSHPVTARLIQSD